MTLPCEILLTFLVECPTDLGRGQQSGEESDASNTTQVPTPTSANRGLSRNNSSDSVPDPTNPDPDRQFLPQPNFAEHEEIADKKKKSLKGVDDGSLPQNDPNHVKKKKSVDFDDQTRIAEGNPGGLYEGSQDEAEQIGSGMKPGKKGQKRSSIHQDDKDPELRKGKNMFDQMVSPLEMMIGNNKTFRQHMNDKSPADHLGEDMKRMEEVCDMDLLDHATIQSYGLDARSDCWDTVYGLLPHDIIQVTNGALHLLFEQRVKVDALAKYMELARFGKNPWWKPSDCQSAKLVKDRSRALLLGFFAFPYRGVPKEISWRTDAMFKCEENQEEELKILQNGTTETVKQNKAVPRVTTVGEAMGPEIHLFLLWLEFIGPRYLVSRMFSLGGVNLFDSSIRIQVKWAQTTYRMEARLFAPEPDSSFTPVWMKYPNFTMPTGKGITSKLDHALMRLMQLANRWIWHKHPGGGGAVGDHYVPIAKRRMQLSPGWSTSTVNRFEINMKRRLQAPIFGYIPQDPVIMVASEEGIEADWREAMEKEHNSHFSMICEVLKPWSISFHNLRQNNWLKRAKGLNHSFNIEMYQKLLMLCGKGLSIKYNGNIAEAGGDGYVRVWPAHLGYLDFGNTIPLVTRGSRQVFLPLSDFPSIRIILIPFVKHAGPKVPSTATLLVDLDWGLHQYMSTEAQGSGSRLKVIVRINSGTTRERLREDIWGVITGNMKDKWLRELGGDQGSANARAKAVDETINKQVQTIEGSAMIEAVGKGDPSLVGNKHDQNLGDGLDTLPIVFTR